MLFVYVVAYFLTTLSKIIGAMNKMFGVSVSTAADFEQAMARVKAVSGAVGKDFEDLTKQARDLGRDTQYSATQVANSQELLARAGFKTSEIITAMPNLLYMAGAEGMDLASAVDIASNTIRGFGLEASDMEMVANVLAKTSSMTNTSISTLGESFKKLAPYAKAVGIPLKQAAAMIGVIGDAGIKGEAAGTAVASAIRRLATAPKAVEETLKSLGISAKDDKGNFVQFDTLMERIHAKISGMGNMDQMKILSKIFGGISGSSMLTLMNATVSGKLKEKNDELIYSISDAAKNMYDIMSATMQGAQKRLESATEGMRIAIGNHLLPVFTKGIDLMAQFKSWLTKLIEDHPIISKAVIGITTAILGLSGTALILLGGLLSIGGVIKMWPLLKSTAVLALTTIRSQVKMAITSFTGLGASFAKIRVPVIGLIALAAALYYAWQKNLWGIRDMVEAVVQGFKLALSASTDGIAEIDDALAAKLKAAGIFDYAVIMGQVFFRIRKLWNGFVEGLKEAFDFMMGIFDWLKGIFAPVVESGQELLKFLGILKPVAETQTDTWYAWGQLLGRLAPIIIAVITAFKGIRIITGLFGDLGKAIMSMFHLITAHPIIALLAIVAALAVYVYNNWDEITAYLSEKWQKITGLFMKAADWVKRKWQSFKNWWNTPMLSDWFVPVIGWAKISWNLVKGLWKDFWAWWDNTTLGDWFKPIKDFAVGAYDYVKGKWQEFCGWWDSLTLPDIFAVLGECVDNVIAYVKKKWNDFVDWLASLNPFKDWAAPTVDPQTAKAWKSETLQKYGTLDLRPSYMRGPQNVQVRNLTQSNVEKNRVVSTVSRSSVDIKSTTISAEKLQKHIQDITVLNTMSRDFAQRVAEMSRAWQPFKDSLAQGFTEIYATMQGISDRIRGIVIPAVNELASSLSRVAREISAIAQAGNLVAVRPPNPKGLGANVPQQYQRMMNPSVTPQPHALGGIFSQPHIGLVAEAGREVDFISNQPYSMPMLIQQTQKQTLVQPQERQPPANGKVTVSVDVKPATDYSLRHYR